MSSWVLLNVIKPADSFDSFKFSCFCSIFIVSRFSNRYLTFQFYPSILYSTTFGTFISHFIIGSSLVVSSLRSFLRELISSLMVPILFSSLIDMLSLAKLSSFYLFMSLLLISCILALISARNIFASSPPILFTSSMPFVTLTLSFMISSTTY